MGSMENFEAPKPTRRMVSKGAMWTVPTIVVATEAPAMAASACAGIVTGQPLPASAFSVVYLAVTNQTFGDAITDKSISVITGLKIDPTVQTCVGAAKLTLAKSSSTSRITLTNGTTYNTSGGSEASGTGVAGSIKGGCSGGDGTAQVCITITGLSVTSSKNTTSANPSKLSFAQDVTVEGFGKTTLFLNATSFTLSGTTWNGSSLTATPASTI